MKQYIRDAGKYMNCDRMGFEFMNRIVKAPEKLPKINLLRSCAAQSRGAIPVGSKLRNDSKLLTSDKCSTDPLHSLEFLYEYC